MCATLLRERSPAAPPPEAPLSGSPSGCALVCLNDGWGGDGLLESALRWSAGSGRTLTAVHVVTRARPRRRAIRSAERAVLRARRIAAWCGLPLRELVVRAEDVPDGMALAAGATGGEVLVWEGAASRGPELLLAGAPYREIPWIPAR